MLDLLPLAQYLEKLTKQNAMPVVVNIPGVDYARHVYSPVTGIAETVENFPPSVNRHVAYWSDFVEYVGNRAEFFGSPAVANSDFESEDGSSLSTDGAIVTISPNGAKYTESPDCLRGLTAQVDFVKTEAYKFLLEPKSYPQKELVKKLRIFMRGTGEEFLLAKTRNMKFSTGTEGTGNIQHGRASVSKSAREEVFADEGAFPDQYTFNVSLFQNAACPILALDCAIEVDATNQQIAIVPFAGVMENALQNTLVHLSAMLDFQGLQTYNVK